MRAAGVVWGRRKSIAGSEYIQRRSAVRVWKFETAFLARVFPKPRGIRTRRQFAGEGGKNVRRGREGGREKGGGYARRSGRGKRDVNLTEIAAAI